MPPPRTILFEASNSGVNPKVTLSYEQNHDLTLYGTIARGFTSRRHQSADSVEAFVSLTTETYGPDSTLNYEQAKKAKLLDSRLHHQRRSSTTSAMVAGAANRQPALVARYPLTENAGTGGILYGPELEVYGVAHAGTSTMTFSGSHTHGVRYLTSRERRR